MTTNHASFQFFSPRTMISGIDTLNSVAEEIKKLGGTKVLVVTDPGIVEAGLTSRLLDLLEKANIPAEGVN